MSKRPGTVDVVTEVGYCNFCGRTRNLRREEHRLGSLVRTIVTCETCHRTLTTFVGTAPEEPKAEPGAAEETPAGTADEAPATEKRPVAKAASKQATKSSATKTTKAAPKTAKATPAAKSKPAAKKAAQPKSSSSTKRRTASQG